MMSSDEEDDWRVEAVLPVTVTNEVQFQGGTNPLLIPNILDKIFDSLPLSCLFKFRRVCKLWNDIIVPKINKNGNNTRLLKIVDLLGTTAGVEEDKKVKVIDIKEILVTMEAGRLEHSTCTNIYLNDSMEFNPSLFEAFLALNGRNIKVLHYDGNKISELKEVLQVCAQNLERLSLWKLSSTGGFVLYEQDEEPTLNFPKLENITFASGEGGNRYKQLGFIRAIMDKITFQPTRGRSSPCGGFLIDIFEASPKLNSLSCRLFGSRILEALIQTSSYSKLTSLCLKSRVSVPQLRLLISAKMRLKILHLEGLCVTVHVYFDNDPELPELLEFAPLLLEFLKSQASTLEYLKLDLITERTIGPHIYRNIPTDVLLDHFPSMPNLVTFIVGRVDASRTDFPFEISTLAKLFPKLRNLENFPDLDIYDEVEYDANADIVEFEGAGGDEDFPVNYPVSPNASFSLENIRGLKISPGLAQFFPCITELHLNGHIGSIHQIPSCLPRLKHFYHAVSFESCWEDDVLKLMKILNGFMTGISPEEYEDEHKVRSGDELREHLSQVHFARSRPSIFDMNDLETVDFKYLCEEFVCDESDQILVAKEVLISWGLSRMTHLKKLRFKFDQKQKSMNGLPESRLTLLNAFGSRNNLVTHSLGYYESGRVKICLEKNWNFELNLEHHISEWDQLKFFREDPDIWDLGLNENDISFILSGP